MLDSTSGQLEPSEAEEKQILHYGLTARTCGILLIVIGSLTAAGTAVLNRSLRQVDYGVVMTYHGAIGFIVALFLLTVDQLVVADEEDKIKSLDNGLFDGGLLCFGATIDALSVFGQTIAF